LYADVVLIKCGGKQLLLENYKMLCEKLCDWCGQWINATCRLNSSTFSAHNVFHVCDMKILFSFRTKTNVICPWR